MNREMRRLQEREERRQKKQKDDGGKGTARGRSAAQQVTKPAGRAEKGPLWQRLVTFLHEVRVELRKVSWPTREQMIAFTTVTLITTVALTLIVFGADVALKEIVLTLIGGAGG